MSEELLKRCLELFEISEDSKLIRKIKINGQTIVGCEAGNKDGKYRRVRIDGRSYLTHRIIFLMRKGYLPEFIDHKNGNTLDNSIDNLREATKLTNRHNCKANSTTKSKIKGVYNDRGRWKGVITVKGIKYYLGMFSTPEAAGEVVKKKYKELQGEYCFEG